MFTKSLSVNVFSKGAFLIKCVKFLAEGSKFANLALLRCAGISAIRVASSKGLGESGTQTGDLGSGYLHTSSEHEEEVSVSVPLSACLFSDIPVSRLVPRLSIRVGGSTQFLRDVGRLQAPKDRDSHVPYAGQRG